MLKRNGAEGMGDPAQSPELPGVSRPPYWLIAREEARGWEVFTVSLLGEAVLPIFGSEEGAQSFLRSLAEAGEWRPRRTGAGELVSVLSGSRFSAGPCPDVERVVFDPPHLTNEPELEFLTMSRKCFLEHLTGRGRSWFDGTQDR